MKLYRLVLACVVATVPAVAASPNDLRPPPNAAPQLSELDAQVVAHLHAVNLVEIDLGTLARSNGSLEVKHYGDMLVADHALFDAKVAALAKQHGLVPIPVDSSMTPGEKQDLAAERAKLQNLKADAFDREFLDQMVKGHDKEIAIALSNLALVHDADLATMLTDVVPTLRKHAAEARKLQTPLRASR